jgi:hypothetical protein
MKTRGEIMNTFNTAIYRMLMILMLMAFSRESISAPASDPRNFNGAISVQNLDNFPSDNVLVFHRIPEPWRRTETSPFHEHHDIVTIRIRNNGSSNLLIYNIGISHTSVWQNYSLNGAAYGGGTFSISPGSYADVGIRFIANSTAQRTELFVGTLTISSNDPLNAQKTLQLRGLWQSKGESGMEPSAQDIIRAFGFTTSTGFGRFAPDQGNTGPYGDEVLLTGYFVRADASKPIHIRQMGAFHGCCDKSETFKYHPKGSTSKTGVFTHMGVDGQTLLPRRGRPNVAAEGVINANGPFGFAIQNDHTDRNLNVGKKIGFRVWVARDASGNVIPNAYIMSNDYLGSTATNYDYNDNTYYVENIKPESGEATGGGSGYLTVSPEALDFRNVAVGSAGSMAVTLRNAASSGSAITISSVSVSGDNAGEFSAGSPSSSSLAAQQSATVNVSFRPSSMGLKTANLNVYVSGVSKPYRVVLYGMGSDGCTSLQNIIRINSGTYSDLTLNGDTWKREQYSYDNLEPYKNSQLTSIAGSVLDAMYLTEQSSNGDLRPFRYAVPVANGNYQIRLHFAEIYHGVSGGAVANGVGARIFSVAVEGQTKISNMDIYAEVGPAAALIKNVSASVSDGMLDINFTASKNRPSVCGIEIYKVNTSCSTPPPPPPPSASSTVRLNSGGGTVSNSKGTFIADTYHNGTGSTYTNGSVSQINNTSDDNMYLTERTTPVNNGTFMYSIPVASGQYQVILHFAEIWFGSPSSPSTGVAGKRIFDVSIEGVKKLDNYDILRKVPPMTATTESFVVSVSDGTMNIYFSAAAADGGINRPKVSAIEVLPYTSGTTSSSAGSTLTEGSQVTASVMQPQEPAARDEEEVLTVYPNPNPGDRIFVYSNGFRPSEKITIRVYDTFGKQVLSEIRESGADGEFQTDFDMGLRGTKGIYTIVISSGSKNINKKVIVR